MIFEFNSFFLFQVGVPAVREVERGGTALSALNSGIDSF